MVGWRQWQRSWGRFTPQISCLPAVTHAEPGLPLRNNYLKCSLCPWGRPAAGRSCDTWKQRMKEESGCCGARGPISSQSRAHNRRLSIRALCRHDNSTCGTRRWGDGGGEVRDRVHLFLVFEHRSDWRTRRTVSDPQRPRSSSSLSLQKEDSRVSVQSEICRILTTASFRIWSGLKNTGMKTVKCVT